MNTDPVDEGMRGEDLDDLPSFLNRMQAAIESSQASRDAIMDALEEIDDPEVAIYLRRALYHVTATQHNVIDVADWLYCHEIEPELNVRVSISTKEIDSQNKQSQ